MAASENIFGGPIFRSKSTAHALRRTFGAKIATGNAVSRETYQVWLAPVHLLAADERMPAVLGPHVYMTRNIMDKMTSIP